MDAGYASEMFGEVFKKLYDSKTGIAYEKVDYPDIDTVMDAVPQRASRFWRTRANTTAWIFCASCAETTASAALKFITRATRRRIKRKCCA